MVIDGTGTAVGANHALAVGTNAVAVLGITHTAIIVAGMRAAAAARHAPALSANFLALITRATHDGYCSCRSTSIVVAVDVTLVYFVLLWYSTFHSVAYIQSHTPHLSPLYYSYYKDLFIIGVIK